MFSDVMAATRAQAVEMLGRAEDKRPYGATWIRGERWNDEVTSRPMAGADAYLTWDPTAERA